MSWIDFDHQIWKQLKKHQLDDKNTFILAISGGLDSMVLLHAIKKLKPKAQIIIVHYHHGDSKKAEVQNYRDQAHAFVKSISLELNLEFFSAKSLEKLESESEFRVKRFEFFTEVKSKFFEAVLVTAHHKDDLLETWLLKMIRGTGAESLENFKFWNGQILRPLLGFTKAELIDYAKTENLSWVEDPTNQENDYLRNWVRNEWLRSLSQKVPGSIANLTNSLQRLIDEIQINNDIIVINYENSKNNVPTKASFGRTDFLQLSRSDQFKALATALKGIGQREFTQGQLEEIIKRLDKNQKDIIFSVAGVNWFINAQQVMLQLA